MPIETSCIGSQSVQETPNLYREVKILKVANGFIVNIGCKTFVSNNFIEVKKGLDLYFKDPVAAEKKYCNK